MKKNNQLVALEDTSEVCLLPTTSITTNGYFPFVISLQCC